MKEHTNIKIRQILSESYDYPKAGEAAQPEVKAAIKRFRKLPMADRKKKPLLYWLTGEATSDLKMSKADSEYTDKSSTKENCGNCEYIWKEPTSDRYICSQISGEIKPAGWCRLWDAAK